MSAHPPPWPMRILIVAGGIIAIPVLIAAIAVTAVLVIVRDLARAVLRLPPVRHRARCWCRRCTHPRPLTRREQRVWDTIRRSNTDLAALGIFARAERPVEDEW